MLARLKTAAEAVGVVLFATMFLGFAVQVVSRYVFNRPITWSNDLILLAFIWWFVWATAFLIPLRQHIAFNTPFRGSTLGRWFRGLAGLICALGFLLTLPGTYDYLTFSFRIRTGAWNMPYGYIYIGFLLVPVMVGLALLRQVWQESRSPKEDPA